jgi:hypothetical protein
LKVRRELKLNRTERPEAKWTQPTRQQEIAIKSESNTKSCGSARFSGELRG